MNGNKIVESVVDFPEWATWSWDQQYLPEEFHTQPGKTKLVNALNAFNIDSQDYCQLEYLALSIGLALRDIHHNDTVLPPRVSSSLWRENNVHALLRLCDDVAKKEGPAPAR